MPSLPAAAQPAAQAQLVAMPKRVRSTTVEPSEEEEEGAAAAAAAPASWPARRTRQRVQDGAQRVQMSRARRAGFEFQTLGSQCYEHGVPFREKLVLYEAGLDKYLGELRGELPWVLRGKWGDTDRTAVIVHVEEMRQEVQRILAGVERFQGLWVYSD